VCTPYATPRDLHIYLPSGSSRSLLIVAFHSFVAIYPIVKKLKSQQTYRGEHEWRASAPYLLYSTPRNTRSYFTVDNSAPNESPRNTEDPHDDGSDNYRTSLTPTPIGPWTESISTRLEYCAPPDSFVGIHKPGAFENRIEAMNRKTRSPSHNSPTAPC
jgi:hypothetical protein